MIAHKHDPRFAVTSIAEVVASINIFCLGALMSHGFVPIQNACNVVIFLYL